MCRFSLFTKGRRANAININHILFNHFYAGIGVHNILKYGIMVAIAGVLISLLVLIAGLLPSYLEARFSTLTNPFSAESGTGYHISNSLMAIGNGGLFGRGLGNSIMKLGYLPEPHTDFIFAVICEELGLVGGLFVILLEFSLFIVRFSLQIKLTHIFINWFVLVSQVILEVKHLLT